MYFALVKEMPKHQFEGIEQEPKGIRKRYHKMVLCPQEPNGISLNYTDRNLAFANQCMLQVVEFSFLFLPN